MIGAKSARARLQDKDGRGPMFSKLYGPLPRYVRRNGIRRTDDRSGY